MQWIVGLNTLRFFAIALIVIYHFFRSFMPGGFLAVEIFFALSGYLLGSKLLSKQEDEKKNAPIFFIKKRLKKIWPALLICVLFSLGLAFFTSRDLLAGIQIDTLSALTFSTNFVEIFSGGSYEDTFMPNLFEHIWFLALEVQFCLILPFFIHFTMRKISRKNGLRLCFIYSTALAILSAGLMFAYGQIFEMRDRAYFAPDTQAFAFFGGVALAAWRKLHPMSKRHRRWPAVVPLAVSSALILEMSLFVKFEQAEAGFLQLTALLSLFLIDSILCMQKTRTNATKALRPLELLGKYSFGIYLYHWPLMILLPRIIKMSQMVNLILAVSTSLMMAVFVNVFLRRKLKTKLIVLVAPAVLSALTLALTPFNSNIMTELEAAKTETSAPLSVAYVQLPKLDSISSEIESLAKTAKTSDDSEPVSQAAPSPNAADVLVIGDSVTLGAKAALESKIANVYVDAEESRGIEKAHTILDAVAASGDIPPVVVVSLTTNERTFTNEIMQEVVDSARGSTVIFVTGYASELQPREEQNAAIKEFANSHDGVYYADWWEVAINDLSLLYDDHIHLNFEGREAYADLIYDAVFEAGGAI